MRRRSVFVFVVSVVATLGLQVPAAAAATPAMVGPVSGAAGAAATDPDWKDKFNLIFNPCPA